MPTRPRSITRLLSTLAVVAGIAATSACGSDSAGADGGKGGGIPDGPIRIGMVAELSGQSAAIGNYQVKTQKALAVYINAHGGIAGHKVELVVENNQSDPATAVISARKLVQKKVAATVFTGLTSSGKDQVLSVLAKAKIPSIDPTPDPKYDNPDQYPYFFSDNPTDQNAMVAVAGFAKKHGYDQIGQLGDSTPFAKSLEEHFSDKAKAAGLTILKTVDYPTTATTMTTQLSLLRESGVKTIGLWCQVSCGKVYDGLRQIGWAPPVLTTHVMYYAGFDSVKELGKTTFGDCPISVPAGAQPNKTMRDVIEAVAAKTGGVNVTSQGIPLNADSWLILKTGIEKANSLDGAKIVKAIESIKGKSFANPDIEYTFSADHHSGFAAAEPESIPMCGFGALGPLSLPIQVK
jgi:branched-chain amino acid transport system substrate-binding protein